MTNWKKIAEARDLGIPGEAIETVAPSLDALENAFRPLAAGLTGDIEPAIIFRAEDTE
jgi:hypothetical protein